MAHLAEPHPEAGCERRQWCSVSAPARSALSSGLSPPRIGGHHGAWSALCPLAGSLHLARAERLGLAWRSGAHSSLQTGHASGVCSTERSPGLIRPADSMDLSASTYSQAAHFCAEARHRSRRLNEQSQAPAKGAHHFATARLPAERLASCHRAAAKQRGPGQIAVATTCGHVSERKNSPGRIIKSIPFV